MENYLLKENSFLDELVEQDSYPSLLLCADATGASGPRDGEEYVQEAFLIS